MRTFFVLTALALCLLSSCMPVQPLSNLTGPEVDYQYAAALARGGHYPEAAAAFRKISAEAPNSMLAADAEFETAYLYTLYDNPQKDYTLALAGFTEFLKRYPNHTRVHEAQNWQALLKSLLETVKENERMKKSIEQLKKLDIRHEERRRK